MEAVMWVQPHYRVSALQGSELDVYGYVEAAAIERFKVSGLVNDLPENLRGGALEWAEPFKSNVVLADGD